MSHVREKSFWEKLRSVNSLKGFAQNFILRTMAGQKLFLYNEKIPRVLNISFNEKTCFYTCKMCPYAEQTVRDMYKEGSEMSFETLKNLVASVPNDSFYSFDMSAIGETLLFKPLPEFIAYMKKERPRVNTIISTNGVLLSEKVFRALAESGLDNIQISLFAANAADHSMITGTDTFEKVCENIRTAARIKKELGLEKPYLQTFMMVCEETKQHVEEFKNYWSQYVDSAFSRPLYNLGREIEGMTPNFETPPQEDRYPCIYPWYSTAINSKGDVLYCYIFHWHKDTRTMKVGNINEQSLAEIWASPQFKEFRRRHLSLELEPHPVCQNCNGWAGYTNIWERHNGGYRYSKIRLRDFFTPVPEQRGG